MFMEKTGDNLSEKSRVTYSKHDILYSKARYVLNQRHIKRPWFNLNPFLEKTVDLEDLDQFLPGDSKYIQPLKSLVLCESFHSDHPLDTTELGIDAFFKYLHSDKWSDGCSVRVLEGQLLDQLLLGLYRMEHDGTAVRHTTHAFAKNNRKRTGCYKLSTAESLDSIAETLLLEFAYFGRLTKDVPNEKSLDPFEYLHQPDDEVIEIPAEVPSTPQLVKATVGGRRQRGKLYASSLSIKSQGQTIVRPNWGPHGSLMSKHMHAINTVNALQRHVKEKRQSANLPNISSPPDKNKSIVMSPRSSPESKSNSISTPPNAARNRRVPEPSGRQHSVAASPFAYSTSQTKRTKPALDSRDMSEVEEEKLSPKVSKKGFVGRIYELDFEDDNISDEGESVDEDTEFPVLVKKNEEFFGEEFYLSDKVDDNMKPLSAKQKLRLNKIELHKKREEIKAKQKQYRNLKVGILPPLPPLDLSDIDSQNIKHETIDMPDEMPTFEEFIQLLKEDEYYDPRYRNRIRLKSRRIAQRYYNTKGQHRSSVVYSCKAIPSEIRNTTGYRPSSRKSSVPTVHRGTSSIDTKKSNESESARLPALQETAGRIAHAHDDNDSCADLEHQSEEVKGVTDSDSCKEHYLKNRKFLNTGDSEPPTKKSSPRSDIKPPLVKDSQNSGSKINSTKDSPNSGVNINSAKSPVLLFTRNSSRKDESEGSDSNIEEDENDEPVSEVFDAKKLNLRYSTERLKKRRRSRVKQKKPAFIEILAKYYNVSNVLRVFRKDSPDKDSKSTEVRGSVLGKLIGRAKIKVKEKKVLRSNIGKLKHFNFCDSKPKKNTNLEYLSHADFTQPDLDTFCLDLKEAVDYFVVRREIVVSDLQTFNSAITSITFTRKSCFQHKHNECKA